MSDVKIKRDTERWEVSVHTELPAETIERHYVAALKNFQKETKVAGFRPGHAPISEVLCAHGEEVVLEKAAEHAIREELPKILAKEHVLVVDTPRVTVETLSRGKPLVFTARASLPPSVELPDYKSVAAKHNALLIETAVSDEEYNQANTHLRRERARVEHVERGLAPHEAAEKARSVDVKELPELDDAFIKTLGYADMQQFSTSVRSHLKSEKERHEIEKRRAAILEELIRKSNISYPTVFKEYELDDMEARLKADLERMQTTFETHLTQVKKTRDTLRSEWGEAADKRAKIRLILGEVARKENIVADKAIVEKNLEHAHALYPNASIDALRINITHALQNEAVLKFLEEQK